MSHQSRARQFRPMFDSLASRIAPSTGVGAPPCPMDPTIILPPVLITPTVPSNPMGATLVLIVPLNDGAH